MSESAVSVVLANVPGNISECVMTIRFSPRTAARANAANVERFVVSSTPPFASTVPSGTYDVRMPSSRSTASIRAKRRASRSIARIAPWPAENAVSVTCPTL